LVNGIGTGLTWPHPSALHEYLGSTDCRDAAPGAGADRFTGALLVRDSKDYRSE